MQRDSRRPIPTPGARPYEEDLADYFFGRDEEIKMLLDYIDGQRLSVLAADSASGKTSLLQAGLVPILRNTRLLCDDNDIHQLPPFPLLLNQWLGRVGSLRGIDFLRLIIIEIDRYLSKCKVWYLREAKNENGNKANIAEELARIQRTINELSIKAIELKLMSHRIEGEERLIPIPLQRDKRGDYRKMTEDLQEILSVINSHLGQVILILDQFEEILSDPLLGKQAQVAVESIFRLRKMDVSQFISLRSDSVNMLIEFERRGLIEGKRRVYIKRLTPKDAKSIILLMSKKVDITWDNETLTYLDQIIDTFTLYLRDGGPSSNVNMLGLQVVIRGLFSHVIEKNNSYNITKADLCQYFGSLEGKGFSISESDLKQWIERQPDLKNPGEYQSGHLAEAAPRAWIDQCLDGFLSKEHVNIVDDLSGCDQKLIKPMVMRMADWLVTPAGFKRPLRYDELEKIAFRNDLERHKLSKYWTEEDDLIIKSTYELALRRLVNDGHVLKERGGETGGTYYELVHDQLGEPLKRWAQEFANTPNADIGWRFQITDKQFPWHGELKPYVPTGSINGAAWIGCIIENVHFSDMELDKCNFTRTVFIKCQFRNVIIRESNFTQSVFQGCSFADCIFNSCSLKAFAMTGKSIDTVSTNHSSFADSISNSCTIANSAFNSCDLESCDIRGGAYLNEVIFMGGSLSYAYITDAKFKDCIFRGTDNEFIGMRNLILVNIDLVGNNIFEKCSLDGATLGAEPNEDGKICIVDAENIIFRECDLSGIEIKNIRFLKGLLVERVRAKGAVFEQVILPEKHDGYQGIFQDVILSGAVFLGCEIHNTIFSGPIHVGRKRSLNLTEAFMVVFRDLRTAESIIPTILDNVSFKEIDMENFVFQRCQILGPVEFRSCQLSGGTIVGSNSCDKSDPSWDIKGPIRFRDQSILDAMEFRDLSIVGRNLEISSCSAKATYFSSVHFSPKGRLGSLFQHCNMASAMFLNCSIEGVNFKGAKGNRMFLETLTIKGTDNASCIKRCIFKHAVLDGFILDGVNIKGSVNFSDCKIRAARIGNHSENVTDSPMNREPMMIAGTLSFINKCDLRDIILSNVIIDESGLFYVEGGTCDGGTFMIINLEGKIIIKDSSLLRTKFSLIKLSGEKSLIDFQNSDLFFAEVDDDLLQTKKDIKSVELLPCIQGVRKDRLDSIKLVSNIYKRF
ncbi:MAG: pentapeptide repeat-containing protein [Syntrophales bacterium]